MAHIVLHLKLLPGSYRVLYTIKCFQKLAKELDYF